MTLKRRKTVLVIDDDQTDVDSTAALITTWGHRAVCAYDGASGILLARSEHPDVILIGMDMPGLGGYAVAKKLRSEPQFKNTLLIAVTGIANSTSRKLASRKVFDLHCAKPFDPAYLRQVISYERDDSASEP